MKKAACLLLSLVMLILVLSGCSSSNSSPSEKAISIGKQALTVTDEYLDGLITYSIAIDLIDGYEDDMDYVSDIAVDDEELGPTKAEDTAVQTYILGISVKLNGDNLHGDSDSYEALLEARNKLAKAIGEDTRKN